MATPVIARIAALALAAWFVGAAAPASAQGAPPALGGKVMSDREGPMEGVLVSAKKPGSTITVTVVSDANGAYAFPADRLTPGNYQLKVRATGYALDGAGTVELAAGRTAVADLKLKPAPVRVRATDQCRIAGERARSSRAEAQPAQLHGLPFAAPDFQLEAQPRRFQEGVRAHGHLLSGRLGHAAAAARRRAPPSGRQSGAGGQLCRLSRSAQSQRQRRRTASNSRPRRARRAAPRA